LAALVILHPVPSGATLYESFGFSPRGVAMSGALTASADDFTATFYNPAMLVLRKDFNVGLGFDYGDPAGRVEAKGEGQLDCSYCDPDSFAGFNLGLLFPLGGKVANRVALGLGLHGPAATVASVRAPDPNRPFWYGWHNRQDRILVFVGAGVRIVDELTVGVGLQTLADLVGNGAATRVDLFARQVRFKEVSSDLANTVAPNAGVYWSPTPALRLGASFRGEMGLVYRIPANIDLEGVSTLNLVVEGIDHYSPPTLTGGVAWQPTPSLTLALDGSYQLWSRAPSPYMDITVDLEGETLRAMGLDEALDLESRSSPPGFEDTVETRLGIEYQAAEGFVLRGGFSFRPTPVPRQSAAGTNILDGTTVGVSGGMGFSFDDPLEVLANPLTFELAGRGLFLLPREAEKDRTDELPPYTYSASVFGVSVAFRYSY
jgi:long-subunit fatty acid transport protein